MPGCPAEADKLCAIRKGISTLPAPAAGWNDASGWRPSSFRHPAPVRVVRRRRASGNLAALLVEAPAPNALACRSCVRRIPMPWPGVRQGGARHHPRPQGGRDAAVQTDTKLHKDDMDGRVRRPSSRPSTYLHRRMVHMIVFRGLRVGSGAPAMSGHRQAALTPSGGREKRPFGRPCGFLRSRRAALVMDRHHGGPRSGPEKPARPSDLSSSYESSY